MAEHLTIGEFASRAGVATSTLRFYEARGLIQSERTSGNQRRFPRSELRRVAFIRTSQRVGLSLEEIAEALANLPTGRVPTRDDWTRLSRHWRRRLDEQITTLQALRDKLDGCIGCGCLSLKTCQLANPDDVMAEQGPGAPALSPRGR